MKRIFLFSTLVLCISYGDAQTSKDGIGVVNKLKNYFTRYDPEKAYLQFDRPYYAAGDTIYFKAYTTQGGHHKLSALSGVLYVELINPESKIDQSIKLRLDSGVCWGDFALPDTLTTGNYRIRAYTRWMQNFGELDFFDQIIPVGSITKRNFPDSLTKQPQPLIKNKADIQFFPEGGTLVEGISTKLAFKAIGANGLGIHVKGVVVDKSDKPVCTFESSHLGMGYFIFIPENGNIYKARLTFADGTQNIADMPKAEASGMSLSVSDDEPSNISVSITANEKYYQASQNRDYLLVIYSGGRVMTYDSKQEDPRITLNIERKLFQTGVSTISLFSPGGEPLCERLVFVQNNDLLRLQIHTDKSKYRKNEKVNLVLNAKTPKDLSAIGHFSMTIVDETQMHADENNDRNILTDLLLTSDLKGYVEQPNYYFNDTTEEMRKNLDLLMLTQGYRNFEWEQVLGSDSAALAFQPEKGLEIDGQISNLSDKPISGGTVTLIPSNSGQLLNTKSDNKGLFRFSNLVFDDTTHFVLSAVNAKGNNSTRITYFNRNDQHPVVLNQPYGLPVMEDTPMLSYFEKAEKMHEEFMSSSWGKVKMLKPVTVKAVKLDNQYRTQSFAGAGHADQVMHADEIGKIGGKLSTSLNGRLHGVGFINGIPYLQAATSIGHPGPMLIVLDGTEFRASPNFNIDDILTSQVETVEVLKYASMSIYGMDGANGVLVITTKNGDEDYRNNVSIGVLPITTTGFYKARTFYSPKYDYANGNVKEPKLPFTMYWSPEIKTDRNGTASLDYYNPDRIGAYRMIVEGIDNDGNVGRLVYRYQVE